jgi:excisionase family DNA binding protein
MSEEANGESLFLRVEETARLLGTSRQTIYDLINRGELEHVRLPGRSQRGMLRIPRAALHRLIAAATKPTV